MSLSGIYRGYFNSQITQYEEAEKARDALKKAALITTPECENRINNIVALMKNLQNERFAQAPLVLGTVKLQLDADKTYLNLLKEKYPGKNESDFKLSEHVHQLESVYNKNNQAKTARTVSQEAPQFDPTPLKDGRSWIYSIPVIGSIVEFFVASIRLILDLFGKKDLHAHTVEPILPQPERIEIVIEKAPVTPPKIEIAPKVQDPIAMKNEQYMKKIEIMNANIDTLELNEKGYETLQKYKKLAAEIHAHIELQAKKQDRSTDQIELWHVWNPLDTKIDRKDNDFYEVKAKVKKNEALQAELDQTAKDLQLMIEKEEKENAELEAQEAKDKMDALAYLNLMKNGVKTLEDYLDN